jgi:hypothetical protein
MCRPVMLLYRQFTYYVTYCNRVIGTNSTLATYKACIHSGWQLANRPQITEGSGGYSAAPSKTIATTRTTPDPGSRRRRGHPAADRVAELWGT